MKIINGWSEQEMQLLSERTKQPLALVARFCQAVDKPLYMMLPEHLRRATLYFHLSPERTAQITDTTEKEAFTRPVSQEQPQWPLATEILTKGRAQVATPDRESQLTAPTPLMPANVVNLANFKNAAKSNKSTPANQVAERAPSTEVPKTTKANDKVSEIAANTIKTKKLTRKSSGRKSQSEPD